MVLRDPWATWLRDAHASAAPFPSTRTIKVAACLKPYHAPSPSLARVTASPSGWEINTRGLRAARAYAFTCGDCAAEFARTLRDEGGWLLRFGPGCEAIAAGVAELDEAWAA